MKILFLIFIAFNFVFATIDLKMQNTTIFDVNKQTAKIKIPNLIIGQSGVVVKDIEENSLILAQGSVIESNSIDSTIKFSQTPILVQEALPTTKRVPKDGNTFILNHLYNTSLLIVPNVKAKSSVLKLFPKQNFLDEDFFASYLKLNNTPVPTKKDISKFALTHQMGTIFIVVQNNLFIVDSLSFKVLDTIMIKNDDKNTNVPFLSKIDKIETATFSLGSNRIENYDLYYLKLMEIIK
jgi:hypothetical protein